MMVEITKPAGLVAAPLLATYAVDEPSMMIRGSMKNFESKNSSIILSDTAANLV